jgi:tryptophanyl-tRNA synthetase
MKKPILISGIQPSGKLHLGNYLGALKNFVELQNSGEYDRLYFFVADYHSLTEEFDPKAKHSQTLDLLASYLAAGLDPKKSVIFLQSDVPACTELAWILSAVAPFGELRRMTQFKDKGGEDENVGLFTYPVLMAADILLYDGTAVPVGEDQLQHLELTRALARKFNSRFGEVFAEPKSLLAAVPRLMSLDDPAKKMSKSREAGCLFVDDEPKIIEEKIKRAVTDSGHEIKYLNNKPGIANLLDIAAALSGKSIPQIEKEFEFASYSDFKLAVAKTVSDYFADFRKTKTKLLQKPAALEKVLANGKKTAAAVATAKIEQVKKLIGL